MKYACEIVIDKPRSEVVQLFDNADNLKFWQKGLISFDHLSGEPGKPGAESKLTYEMNKRVIEMIETITYNHLPDEMHSNYQTKGVVNFQKNVFIDEGSTTRWISNTEFKFKGFMKWMSFFMGTGAFQKQTQSFMDDFKAFAEGNPKYGN